MANAAAVEAKLLLSEYSKCGCSGRYGDHQPSAITWPCRIIIKLCISMSGADSRVSRKVKMPSGWTPWDSAELCGSALTLMPASLERDHYHSWESAAQRVGATHAPYQEGTRSAELAGASCCISKARTTTWSPFL